jgi:DNA-binding NarL/FixJ family response regulator
MRVLIADDHPVFRHGIRAILSAEPDLDVVGEASGGAEAVALAAELRPDLVLMDVSMPGVNGIEATRQILAANPDARILMITMFEDDSSVFTAMRAGARGYVLKDAEKQEMLRAIRAAGNGEAIFSPAVATRVIDYFASGAATRHAPEQFPELTDREREILALIAAGHRNQAIAAKLHLSHSTVRNYVSSIFAKMQVADRPGAIIRARAAGISLD